MKVHGSGSRASEREIRREVPRQERGKRGRGAAAAGTEVGVFPVEHG